MAIYKCKMCGGDLEIKEGVTVVECEYCGTKQTVPTANDEEIRNLFNRANILRRKCEFDKAEELYEKLLLKDEKQPEAYWGVLLCRYGIEYVEDPKTNKRIPTCHRTSFEAITSDEYYKLALNYADPVQKKIYEEEAKYIDGVQKEILALSQKEEPYDVFICYKETDENGKRTEDSAIANDIYYQLTQEGYKVFYAAITLEDKLGSAYEPIIFAALNSSKVMLAIGTKPEYFNAVWVKNEWSRFLKLMKSDKTKKLIPCYRGMDAYELPEEFAHLQAQDMGKIGFITDLVRGIKKVIVREEPKKETPKDTAATGDVDSRLRRIKYFLEDDNDWDRAKEYAEKVLDIDPENAEAYLDELLAELHIAKFEDLYKYSEPIKNLPLFKKAYRFADSALKEKLDNAVAENVRVLEERRLEEAYNNANIAFKRASSYVDYIEAAELFDSISAYKDSVERAKQCREKAERMREEARKRAEQAELKRKEGIYQDGCAKLQSGELETVLAAREVFESIFGFKDVDEKLTECDREIERLRLEKKEEKYVAACNVLRKSSLVESVLNARKDFALLGDYKDCKEKIGKCDARVAELRQIAKERAAAEALLAKKRKKKEIIITCAAIALVIAIIVSIIVPVSVVSYNNKVADKVARAGLTYTLSDDGSYYIVSDVEDKSLEEYIIPETYRGLPVNEIGNKAFYDSKMKSITIPDSVTSIGVLAFCHCESLTSIVIPNSVAFIGNQAFGDCTSLTSIVISNSVTSIGNFVFYHCESLTNITIPNSVTSIGDDAFSGCASLENVNFGDKSKLETIGYEAFEGCTNLTNITIPNSVISIDKGAFFNCTSLETVYWNATNCETAGNYTYSIFEGCTALTTVYIGENVEKITSYAFYKCTSLESITIPDSVTSIGDDAFYKCTSLESVNFGNNSTMTSIGEYAFYDCTSLENITIPDSVTSIGDEAFESCTSLENITIPDSVTSIGDWAFYGCKSLENVTIGQGVTSIGYNAFENCTSLETVYWNATNCETAGSYTYSIFEGCTALTTVYIGENVEKIPSYAFRGCTNLKNVYFLDPNGWKASYHNFLVTELSNSATAANYLTDEYYNYEWSKS